MRNLTILRDEPHVVKDESGTLNDQTSVIVSIAHDKATEKVYLLTNFGVLFCFSNFDDILKLICKIKAEEAEVDVPKEVDDWFNVEYITATSSVVLISHSGCICSASDDEIEVAISIQKGHSVCAEVVGVIDGGIAAASWNPDQSCIVLLTRNNTLLCMANTWDVLFEVPVEPMVPGSPACISWKGDGELFAVSSSDAISTDSSADQSDGLGNVRIYNRQLELISTARNIADSAAASVMKGVKPAAVGFASNGTYVALAQERVRGRLQIALLERNGQRHGEIDPELPELRYRDRVLLQWEVCAIQWDIASSLVAVAYTATEGDSTQCIGAVQLYYRENFHWYLKQQWVGPNLRFLGFDTESINRLYLSETTALGEALPLLRVIEITWDVARADTSDGTVAVVNGSRLLLTPLGKSMIPPPMCKHTERCRSILEADDSGGAVSERSFICGGVSFCSTAPATATAVAEAASGGWFMGLISHDADSFVLCTGDEYGKITSRKSGSIRAFIQSVIDGSKGASDVKVPPALQRLDTFQARSFAISHENSGDDGDACYLMIVGTRHTTHSLGSEIEHDTELEYFERDWQDEILVLCLHDRSSSGTGDAGYASPLRCSRFYFITQIPGRVTRIAAVGGSEPRACVCCFDSISSTSKQILFSLDDGESMPVGSTRSLIECGLVQLGTVPELCTHFTVINGAAASSDDETESIAITLSARNRLYSGESLLVTGASSFACNSTFGVLMYATVGTRPHLHFCSYERLCALDPMQHADAQDTAEFCEPRPIERGSRLVISIAGDSKVVLQHARGNLEGIEPRPLILKRCQLLLQRNEYLNCLLLLRKQRVDMNYLVDYDPERYMDNVPSFVGGMVGQNPDLIALFVTVLEETDVMAGKYRFSSRLGVKAAPQQSKQNVYGTETKVNAVCKSIRRVLLPMLVACLKGEQRNVPFVKLVQSALCAYAKQQPADLVGALQLIRACCCGTSDAVAVVIAAEENASGITISADCVRSSNLSSAVAIASIKYLAFLAEGQQIFEAALGQCDFDMARAVARQCQMDPKVYLPLLEDFENIGRGHEQGSIAHAAMHFAVNVHLQRKASAVDWYCKFISSCINSFSEEALPSSSMPQEEVQQVLLESDTVSSLKNIIEVSRTFVDLVMSEDLLAQVLPKLSHINLDYRLSHEAEVNGIIDELGHSQQCSLTACHQKFITRGSVGTLNITPAHVFLCVVTDVRAAYAESCMKSGQYREAVSSFLALVPADAVNAIRAARYMGDWNLALMVAAKHASAAEGISVQRVAQEIVAEFREEVEQSESFSTKAFASSADAVSQLNARVNTMTALDLSAGSSTAGGSYSGAMHGSGDRILEAARLYIDYCDDVEGAISLLISARYWKAAAQLAIRFARSDLQLEIVSALESAVAAMIDELPERSAAMVQLVEELTVMWKDPAQRLEQISTTDAALMEEMQMTAADGEDDNASVADAASEYSAATQQSMMSTRSDRSDSSRQSGTSTVSILSQLSTASSSRGGGGGAGKEQSGAFSIEGIEHSLLSRGNVDHYESSAVKGSGYSKGKRNRGKHACAGAGAGASGGATEEGEGDGSVINTNVSTSEGQKSKKVYKRDSTPRRQRRIERSKTKAGSRDVWGLRRENAVCEELLGYALVDSITRSASEMSDVLSLLSSSPRHQALVMQLQQAVEAHLQVLQSNPPPVAPHYPLEWLKKRAMGSVRYYQDIEAMILATPMKLHLAASGGDADEGAAGTAASATATATAAVTMASLLRIDASAVRTAKAAAQLYQQHAAAAVPTWWALAARGLREWYAHGSRLTLQLPVEHKAASVLGDPAASLEHK